MSIPIGDSEGFQSAQEWLTEITRPVDPGSTVESLIEFKVIVPDEDRGNFADDEDLGFLEELFDVVGFDSKQLIVENETVDFNVHYKKNSFAGSTTDEHLPLYSIAERKFGVCWTCDLSSCSLRGVVWYGSDGYYMAARILLENLSRFDRTDNHALFPAMLVLQMYNTLMRDWVNNQANAIFACQVQTGYHYYVNPPSYAEDSTDDHKATPSDLESMTRRISGLAVNITTSVLRLQRMVQLADFILEEIQDSVVQTGSRDRLAAEKPQNSRGAVSLIARETRSARRRAEGLLLEAEAWKHKSSIMVQTMLSLTTQQDQKISIGIADDSRTLAVKATRDSTSMKAIAAVTMCFLPGTFVASLFATPMFDWEASTKRHVSSQFWIYWVVTLPLTIVVVAVWLFWTRQTSLTQKGEENAMERGRV